MIGYALLAIGIAVIVFAAINVYMVFTKQIPPIQLFSFPAVGLDAGALMDTKPPAGSSPKLEILPANVLNDSSNIFAHLFLMGFIVSIGYKISSLGVMLLRTIEVKVNEKTH